MRTHALAVALDDYLALTATPLHTKAIAALVRLREEAANEVDRLLALLDLIDGDPDMEPCLGAIEHAVCCCHSYLPAYDTTQEGWARSSSDDTEQDCEDEGAQCDDEGAPDDNGMADQGGYGEQIDRANGIFRFVEEVQL